MIELFTTLLATPNLASAMWASLGAGGVMLLNKFLPSSQEKKSNKRDDFNSITQSLFKDIEFLKSEINRYKQDSEHCDKQYAELNDKFIEFKRSYNELELRYNIQVRINKKLADEISQLEEEIRKHLESKSDLIIDEQKPTNRGSEEPSEG
jgi:chromosome segregation ATPase